MKVDLPPVLDYESKSGNLSVAGAITVARAFFAEIERLAGVTLILYTYPAFIGNFNDRANTHSGLHDNSIQTPADASGWRRWEFWQYSDGQAAGYLPNGSRKVNGINGQVDLNEFDGTEAKATGYFDGSQPVAPITREQGAIVMNRLRNNFF